jgi:hypothetical protein
MNRLVALKLIRREALEKPGAVERFRREAEAAAKLSHPNIVTVFDANQSNGVHYLVMECLEGSDLAKLVQERGPLPVGFACDCNRPWPPAWPCQSWSRAATRLFSREPNISASLSRRGGESAVAPWGLPAGRPGNHAGPADHSQSISETISCSST